MKNSEYTGFTTICKNCGEHINVKYTGKTKEGIPSFELNCGCDESLGKKKCDICGHHVGNRQRVGPTGNKNFTVLVDKCYGCGNLYPVELEKLSYDCYRWVWRYNERIQRNYKESKS